MPKKLLPYRPDLKEKAKRLRNNPTPAEKKLWFEYLRYVLPQFYRQKPVGNYIVDFYCPKLQLVIEVDGDSHFEEQAERYDVKRTQALGNLGLQVIRFTNLDILQNFEGACEVVEKIIRKNPPTPFTKED